MPILHWFFKASTNTLDRVQREQCTIEEEEEAEETVQTRDLVISNKGSEERKRFTILLKREDDRACFYSTLQLKHLNSLRFERQHYFWQRSSSKSCDLVSEMGHKAELVAVGCKVLPISDAGLVGPSNADSSRNSSSEGVEKEVQKRRKAVSRMKELMRWAAATKAGKGGIKRWKVLYFRNKMTLKDPHDDASSTSSKISFRWDVGSCSTSSVFSPLSVASTSRINDQIWSKNLPNSTVTLQSSHSNASTLDLTRTEEGCSRGGQWITSDSDFVVLEL